MVTLNLFAKFRLIALSKLRSDRSLSIYLIFFRITAMNTRKLLCSRQGTTSSRAVVFNHDSDIVGMSQREFTQYYRNLAG